VIAKLRGRVAAILAVLAVAAVVLVGWLALVSPEQSKATELQSKIADVQAQLASTEAYVKDPANRQAVKTLKHLKVVLPDDVRMSQVLRQLSAASAVAGVRIDGITPSAPVPLNGGEASPISVVVVGHYLRLSEFMHVLRERVQLSGDAAKGAGRLYSVDSITFAKDSSGSSNPGDTAIISATVALNVYSYDATAVAATGTTATTPTTSSSTAAAAPPTSP
jgi:hypothetical protein